MAKQPAADHHERGRVQVEVVDGVGLLTFDNASQKNAIDAGMWDAMADGVARFAKDEAVRVVILTGGGHLAFATDPAATAKGEGDADADQRRRVAEVCKALSDYPRPVLARIRGECVGLGLIVALAADIRVAARDSGFALPAVKLGAGYDADAVAAVVRLVGPGNAARLLLTGNRIEADEAARIGLISLLVDDIELSDTVTELAAQIVANPDAAVVTTKRALSAHYAAA